MWTLWREHIPIVRKGDVLYRVDPTLLRLNEFHRFDRGPACRGFDVSPDGKTIVYCAGQPQGDIILVENFR
jgi:hypothetical protein